MKQKKFRLFAVFLAAVLTASLLAGCDLGDILDETGSTETETVEETTEAVGGIVGENGRRLKVDYETPGTIAEEAPGIGSKSFTLMGTTLEVPFLTSKLIENGWTFYSESVGQKMVSPETEANIMGFDMYLNDAAYLTLGRLQNTASGEKPATECYVTKLTINMAEGVEFVLPGGITQASTAADVLAVYGDVLENDSFDHVQVGNTMLYYAEHKDTGLSFYFGFNEDGTLSGVTIFS